jgi:Flp pilus assembly protein TadG
MRRLEHRTARARQERGASAVEFALVLPLLLAIVFGIIDFGLIMAQKATLASAARTGARYGSVNAYTSNHTCANVVTQVRDAAVTIGMNSSQVDVTVKRVARPAGTETVVCSSGSPASTAPCDNGPSPDPANPDTLRVEVEYEAGMPVPLPMIDSQVTITGTGVYQCEYS